MSYMRHPVYAWVGGACPDDCPSLADCPNCTPDICMNHTVPDCDRPDHETMHLWARADTKEEGVYDPVHYRESGSECYPSFVSGIAMPLSVFDELVMMRFAELVEEGRVAEAAKRISGCGNFGADTLRKFMGEDPVGEFRTLMEQARMERGGSA